MPGAETEVFVEWPLKQKQWSKNQMSVVLPVQSLPYLLFRTIPNSNLNQYRHDKVFKGPHSPASGHEGVLRGETLASASIVTVQDI